MNRILLLTICALGASTFGASAQNNGAAPIQGSSNTVTQGPTQQQPATAPLKKQKKQKKNKASNPAATQAANGTSGTQSPGQVNGQSNTVQTAPGNTNTGATQTIVAPANTGVVGDPNTATTTNYSTQGSASIDDIVKKSTPIVQKSTNGQIDWTNQYVEAIGESAIDNVKFTNPAQAKLMAKRGAVVIAQRNLLEIVKGVNVTGETTVKDMITSSDYVYTRVDGVVKGAEQVGEIVEDNGIMRVKLRMPLYATNGLASAIYDNLPATNNGAAQGGASGVGQTTASTTNTATATNTTNTTASDAQKLLINLGGKSFDPSMFPVMTDDKGNILLDFKKLYDPTTGKFPQIVQASKQLMTDLNLGKGVQILNAVQDKMSSGKIVISNDSIKKVNWVKIGQTAATVGKFLMMFI